MIGTRKLKIAIVMSATIALAGCAAVMTDIVGQGRGTDLIQQPNTTGTTRERPQAQPLAPASRSHSSGSTRRWRERSRC